MELSLREMMQRASPFPSGRRNRPAPDEPAAPRSVIVCYAGELRRVLRRRGAVTAFVLAASLNAVGHALVALVAAAVAVSFARSLRLRGGETYDFGGHAGALGYSALLLVLVGLAVIAVKGASGVYATFVQAKAAAEVGSALRLRLLDALLDAHRVRHPRHEDHGHGLAPTAKAVGALTDRVRDFEAGLGQGLLGGARAAAQLVPLAALLVALSPRMALVAVATLAIFGRGLERTRGGHRRATRRAARERERLLEAADEAARHADLWVTYGAEARAREALRDIGSDLARRSARLQARSVAMSSANEILGAAALVVATIAARAGWLGKVVDGTTLLAFAFAFFLAYRPLREIADARLALARAQIAYDDLRSALDDSQAQPDTVKNEGDDPPRTWPLAALEVRALRLAHGVCEPVSLRVEPGAVVVLVGQTGIGKTTLLRTLLGLERASGGDVLYGGESIGEAPAGPRSRPFAWVPQDSPLLADTLTANVALACSDADARAALGPLGATHLARSLQGARLGAGGRAVSGGERQWIALARAIATKQPVLLMDEPTTGLDLEAERRVLGAIACLRGRRTVLLVTHRREPLAIADVVIQLEPDDQRRDEAGVSRAIGGPASTVARSARTRSPSST